MESGGALNTTPSVETLHSKALVALQQRAYLDAHELLQQITQLEPGHIAAWTNLAGVRRALGDIEGALAAISGALTVDPRAFFPLFLRGSILEQLGKLVEAAKAYEIALVYEPPLDIQDGHTISGIRKARQLIEKINHAKFDSLSDIASRFANSRNLALKDRVEVLIGNLSGKRRIYQQEPLVFTYPHLPAIEFWNRSEFPWLEELEASTEAIIAECKSVIETDTTKFTPYMRYPKDVPLDQWHELNQNLDWSALHLIERGKIVEENANRCPNTMAALKHVPQPKLQGRTPVALFSILKANTHIPPHTGASNTRLLCHLPLIVPDKCSFRVGGSWRSWEVGQAIVFDDTIEHEARNDSDLMRAVLIFDVENPRLTPEDYEAIECLTQALDEFESSGIPVGHWI